MPVDSISGLPVSNILLISCVSVNEAEASLYKGVSNCSIKLTASTSQVDTNQSMPTPLFRIRVYACNQCTTSGPRAYHALLPTDLSGRKFRAYVFEISPRLLWPLPPHQSAVSLFRVSHYG